MAIYCIKMSDKVGDKMSDKMSDNEVVNLF